MLFNRVLLHLLLVVLVTLPVLGQIDSLELVPFVPRVNFNQKFEPNGVLTGAGQVQSKYTFAFANAISRKPFMHMDYASLSKFNESDTWKDSIRNHVDQFPWKIALQLGLSMTVDGKPEKHYEDKVANGDYSQQIHNLIDFLKSINRQVYLRIGYEFNGEWNGYNPETFKVAYVKIVNALRKENCNNVAIVWCFSPDGKNHEFMRYYPGDEFVDWWAIDLFGQQHFTHPATLAFADSSLAHKRPLMIGESTARRTNLAQGQTALKKWFVPYFNFIRSRPNVKAFCYINQDWAPTFLPDWGDARIENHKFVKDWVRQELANSYYIDAQ